MRIEMSQAVNLRNKIQQSAGNSGLRGFLKMATCQLRKLHDINQFTLHTLQGIYLFHYAKGNIYEYCLINETTD